MKLQSKDLLAALSPLVTIARSKSSNPITNCVLMAASEACLKLMATDLNCWQSEQSFCRGDFEPVCVNLAHFIACIRDGENTLEMAGGKLSIMPSGVKLAVLPAKDFPETPVQKDAKLVGVHLGDLADALDSVFWACSADLVREVLHNVHLTGSAKKIASEATDGRWLAFCEKPSIAADFDFMVNDAYCAQVANALRREVAELSLCESSILVSHDSGYFWCKQPVGSYPITKSIREDKQTFIGEIEIEQLVSTLENGVSVFTDIAKFPAAILEFSKDGLSIESKSANDLHATIAGEFKPLKFKCDMKRLLKCVESLKADKIKVSAMENAIVLSSSDNSVILQKMYN